MKNIPYLFTILFLYLFFPKGFAQNLFIEGGLGVGNIAGKEHRGGKAEIHVNVFKSFQFGQLGLDFSSGGNFLPVRRTTIEAEGEILSPYDTGFGSIALLYRLPIKKYFFIEPRIGCTSLSTFVHTDDATKIKQANLSAGIGIGGYVSNLSLSLRYQYFGKTKDYEGFSSSSNSTVSLSSDSISMILFRISYRFSLDKLFKGKQD